MKIFVISDTHRYLNNAIKVLDQIKNLGVEVIIHCGDHIDDAARLQDRYPELKVYGVAGNCDGMCYKEDSDKLINVDGVPIFVTHGHRHGIKWGSYEELMIDGLAYGAKLAICGHSHAAYLERAEGIILMNPGSISEPRDYSYPSYGIVEIESGHIREISIMQILENGSICRHPVNNIYRSK